MFALFNPNARPIALEFRSNKYFVLTSVCLAAFTDLLLYGIIIPVMPYALQSNTGVPADKGPSQYYADSTSQH